MGVIVVTGGAGGIGEAITRRLLERDDAVVVLDLADSQLSSPRLLTVRGSAADDSASARAIESALTFGPITGWVNCAAHFRTVPVHEASTDQFVDLVASNLSMAVAGCHAAVREFLRHGAGGSIVNLSSHQSVRAVRGGAAYSVAKAAIDGLTRAMAVDYGPAGIRTNSIAPGTVVTDRFDGLRQTDTAEVDALTRRLHPLGRPAEADEVAAAVAFLLSSDSSFINGTMIAVDGGRAVLGLDPEEVTDIAHS